MQTVQRCILWSQDIFWRQRRTQLILHVLRLTHVVLRSGTVLFGSICGVCSNIFYVSVLRVFKFVSRTAAFLIEEGGAGVSGEPAQFDGTGDVNGWLRSLELIFDAKKLTLEAGFLHTLQLLAKSALTIYVCFCHTSYTQLCEMLIRWFPTQHDHFYKFSQLLALRQGPVVVG